MPIKRREQHRTEWERTGVRSQSSLELQFAIIWTFPVRRIVAQPSLLLQLSLAWGFVMLPQQEWWYTIEGLGMLSTSGRLLLSRWMGLQRLWNLKKSVRNGSSQVRHNKCHSKHSFSRNVEVSCSSWRWLSYTPWPLEALWHWKQNGFFACNAALELKKVSPLPVKVLGLWPPVNQLGVCPEDGWEAHTVMSWPIATPQSYLSEPK